MALTIDFETRSAVDLRKRGLYVYAQHPTTEVLCLAVAKDQGPSRTWIPGPLTRATGVTGDLTQAEVELLVREADTIEAHNAAFERLIWRHVLHERLGWTDVPFEKWRCSAAKAAMHSLPRSLGEVARVLRLRSQKDAEGYKVMLKMCKPRKPRRAEREADPQWQERLWWHEDPKDFRTLVEYCKRDVIAERAVSQELSDLPPMELAIWRLDQEINDRGICADVPTAEFMVGYIARFKERLDKECRTITGGLTTTQRDRLFGWLTDRGYSEKALDKVCIKRALNGDLHNNVRRVLELRQLASRTSSAKYKAIIEWACDDARVRGMFMYYGAGTGRWTGKGPQPHNFPRDYFKHIEDCLRLLHEDEDSAEMIFGDPLTIAKNCLRGTLRASPGKTLLAADFSAIEGRVLAWLAGDEEALDVYIQGRDPYVVAASVIYNVLYDDVTKGQRQVGKVSELALGYAGGIGAYVSMGANYGLGDEDFEALLPGLVAITAQEDVDRAHDMASQYRAIQVREKGDVEISHDAAATCDIIKQKWRANRWVTVEYWNRLNEAVLGAVRNPGRTYTVGGCVIGVRGKFLAIRLPGGDHLRYFEPSIRSKRTPWGAQVDTVFYWGVDSMTHKWVETDTYGGKIAENITQRVARNLLRDAMLRADAAGYKIIHHVHDEIVCEVDHPLEADVKAFEALMSELPPWAEGIPVAAEGWVGERYRK